MRQPTDIHNFDLNDENNKVSDGYTVPDGYFDNLTLKIQNQISNNKKGKTIRFAGYFNPKNIVIVTSIAAAVITGLLLVPVLMKNEPTAKQELSQTVTSEQTESAIFDESLALQVESDYQALDFENEVDLIPVAEHFASDTTISNEDIIQYLENEDLDTDLLAEL